MSNTPDLIRLPLVHREVEDRLAAGAVGHERIVGHLEVDEAVVGVPAGKALPHVLVDLALVVLALLEPPEAFGARGHVLHDLLVRELPVPVHDDLADRHPLALIHVEHDPDPAVVLGQLEGLDLGAVVAAVLVQRIDGRPRLLHGVPVDRPALREPDAILDLALGDLLDPAHGPLLEHRALFDLDHQDQAVAGARGLLLDEDVVELAGAEERGDGALDVAVVDGLLGDQPRGTDDLGRGEPPIPDDGDTVDGGRLFVLGGERRRSPQEEGHGGGDEEVTLHPHSLEVASRRRCGAGGGRP